MQDIKLKTVDIKPEQMKINKISGGAGGAGGIADQLQELIIKIQFREKYMKKKGIEQITADLEEEINEADETFEFSSMNIKDGGESVWIMCNDPSEREKIRNFILNKEVTLVIESEGKRFFGKFAQTKEKEKWKAANKEVKNIFGSNIKRVKPLGGEEL